MKQFLRPERQADAEYVRAEWFSTLSSVNLLCDPSRAAVIKAVAEGRHEFGHMYFLMKSSAL